MDHVTTRRQVIIGGGLGTAVLSVAPALLAGTGSEKSLEAPPWSFLEHDLQFRKRYVEPFLPSRIFDAHAHLYRLSNFPLGIPDYLAGSPEIVGLEAYRGYMEWLHPGNLVKGGVFFGFAFEGDVRANNDFVAQEVEKARRTDFVSFGQMLVSPEMDASYVKSQVRRHGFSGLKPYHLMAKAVAGASPTINLPIEMFLTEDHVRVANDEELSITLHVGRSRGLADPGNIDTISRYCTNYPKLKMIIAHTGGMNMWHVEEGARALAGLKNIWFDTGAVTEAGGLQAIIQTFGPSRLLYGTDFWASLMRGRYASISDTSTLLGQTALDEFTGEAIQPVLIGLEELRSIFQTLRLMKLTAAEVDGVFFNNAMEIFSR